MLLFSQSMHPVIDANWKLYYIAIDGIYLDGEKVVEYKWSINVSKHPAWWYSISVEENKTTNPKFYDKHLPFPMESNTEYYRKSNINKRGSSLADIALDTILKEKFSPEIKQVFGINSKWEIKEI